jgi:hypothetical protein
MKKILIAVLVVFFIIPAFGKGIDFSIGGSYRFGFHYAYDYLMGFHQQAAIPFMLTYYPGKSDVFSFGFRNIIGYGFTLYDKNKGFSTDNSETSITFNTFPTEHEIYENLSFIIKAGKSVKFVAGIGCSLKYSFVNIPDGSFQISYNPYNIDIKFNVIEPGDYNYLSIGPSFDINLQVVNKSKNFTFIIGVPFEFLIPLKNINKTEVTAEVIGSYIYLIPKKDNRFYLNFSFGPVFAFSFYSFKSLEE